MKKKIYKLEEMTSNFNIQYYLDCQLCAKNEQI